MVAVVEPVDTERARAALATVVPRLTALIRSIHDPGAHAIGEWDAGDVVLHLCDGWSVLPDLLGRRRESPLGDVRELGTLTTTLVRSDRDRDVRAAADRIDAAAAAFLPTTGSPAGATPGAWLVRGVETTVSMSICHLLSEALVHGDDIARSQHRRWRIDPEHARLAVLGFVMPIAARLDPRSLVREENARGAHACYDIRIRGGGRVWITFDDASMTVEPASVKRRADCHLSFAPAALLLQIFGRRSQWSAVLRGQVLSWGRRPWLGLRLRRMLRNP